MKQKTNEECLKDEKLQFIIMIIPLTIYHLPLLCLVYLDLIVAFRSCARLARLLGSTGQGNQNRSEATVIQDARDPPHVI